MATTNTVEKVEIIGSSRGLDSLEADLERVAIAQDNVAASTKATEVVTERSSRSVVTLQRGLEKQARSLDAAYKSQQDYQRNLSLLNKGLDQGAISAGTHAQRLELLNQRYGMFAAANDNAATQMTRFERASGLMSIGLNKAALALTAATTAALAGAAAFGSVISTATEFQRLGASLKTVTGSAENADRAFAFIKQFAAETPYTLQEVTQSFIRLQSLGLDPSRKALEAYGNVASALGTPMMQFVEAVADAMTGEFERLKEFGIKASQDGDKVSLRFQGVTKTIGNNAKEIEAYLQDIGRNQFGGAMAEQMKILPGVFGNAADAVDNFKNSIGEGGLTSAVAGVVSRFTEWLNANKDLAASIGSVVGGGIELYASATSALTEGLVEASRWIQATTKVVMEIAASFTAGSETVSAFGSGMSTVAGGMLTAADAIATGWRASGEAIYATLNAIIGAGVGAYQAVKAAWDQLPAAFGMLATEAGNALVTGLEVAVNGALAGINKIVAGINSIAPDFAQVPEIPAVDLSAFKGSLTDAQAVTKETITTILSTAQATDYLGAGLNALGAPFTSLGGQIAEAKKGLDDAAAAARVTAPEVKLTGEGFKLAADGADAAGEATSGAAKKAEKAAESYAKQGVAIDGTIADLERQIAVLGQSEGASAAAEFKARELAKAWETAREAGKDFIPAATLDAIDAAAAKVGGLTDKLGALTEANAAVDEFFPFEKASREAERLQGILNDTSLGLTDVQRSALSMKIDKGFVDAQKAADGLRDTGTKAAEDIGQSFISNVGDVFADVFSSATRDGESFFSSILKGFAGLGSQLAAAGAKNLMGQIFGISDPGAKSAAGIGGILGGAGSTISSIASVPSSAYAPAPTAAMRATTAKMAEGVTSSVSSNLLSSILGAGKSSSHISGLNTNFATALTSMLDAAPAAVRSAVTINSGFRSVARQAELFDAALKKYGSVAAARKWVAPPGNSQHNRGMAADLGYGSGSVKNWIHENAGKYGLAFPLGNEDWHIELAGARGGKSGVLDQKVVAKGVSDGMTDYTRREGGGDPWSGLRGGEASQGLTGAQRGLGAIGAGVGIFSQGYQSGSPLSGGVSGALGGFQAAQALGVAGPVGAVAGAALGILGGVLGGRAQRKAAHQEAAKKWEEMRPQYEAFDRSLSGEGVGNLRSSIGDMWGQLNSFMQTGGAAWKMGSGNSSATFAATGTKMFEKFQADKDEFLDGYRFMIEDLTRGDGMAGSFSKSRAQVKELDEQIKGFVDDVQIAFNSADIGIPTSGAYEAQAKEWEDRRNAALAEAKRAAGEYAISLLYLADETSDVQKAIDSFKGTAAGLQPVLVKLGWSAEEAATVISEKLTQALTQAAKDFTDGFEREINDLSDKGYLNDVSDLLKQRGTAMSDAALLGVDPEVVTRWFGLAAQSIVDGAELTGDAFADLVKAFPALDGVVKAFIATTEEVAATTAEIEASYKSFLNDRLSEALSDRADAESALRAEYERTVDRIAGIRDFLQGIALDDSKTVLSGQAQFEEAQRLYRETLFKANGGDVEAQDALLGVGQAYLDEAKAYYATSEAYGAVYREIEATLKASASKMETELEVARRQASFLGEIAEGTRGLSGLLKDFLDKQAKAAELQKQVDGNRSFGLNPERNRLIDQGLKGVGLNFTGNYGLTNGQDQFLNWRTALPAEQLAVVNGIISQYIGINRAAGGLITGPGTATSDSIRVNASNGEFMMREAAVRNLGVPVMDEINRTGRLPDAAPIAVPMMVQGSNDNGEMISELRALRQETQSLRAEVRQLRQEAAGNSAAVQGAVEDGNRATRDIAKPLNRVVSRL